jgi:FKBP-type peptidyl-prolyl cis-trans isomerase FklB
MRFSRMAWAGFMLVAGCSQQQAPQPQAEQQPAAETLKLETDQQRASYALGMNIANDLKRKGLQLDAKALAQGLLDAAMGALNALQERMMKEDAEKSRTIAEKNKKEGEEFLAQNKGKEGVVTLPSGLQYKILKEGTGKTPEATSTVVTNYRGTLIDGTEFDSSYSRGQPATFAVNAVIRGWTEALLMMKEGSKWQLFVPAELGYGEHPRPGGKIGPDAVLIFEVELLEVKGKS